MAENFSDQLRGVDVDCVLCRNYSPAALLDTSAPIFLWNDAVFSLLENRYNVFTNLAEPCRKICIFQERRAIDRALRAFYTSQWAASAAQKDYGTNSEKTKIVPIGTSHVSNWDHNTARAKILNRSKEICEMIFVGVDWLRKGADVAIIISKYLHKIGFKNRLTLVGGWPPANVCLPEHIQCVGSLPHSDPQARERLAGLFSQAHFMLLPSRADCTPVAINDAMSFGVVPVVSSVGGLPEMVEHGVTGYTCEMNTEHDYKVAAQHILFLFQKYAAYETMALSCFEQHRKVTWDKHANALLLEIRDALGLV